MDQCVEYVYILSANFTQRRRGVGGRHKPFPPDGEAHPSKARARVFPPPHRHPTSPRLEASAETESDSQTEALYCSTGPHNCPRPPGSPRGGAPGPFIHRDEALSQPDSDKFVARLNVFVRVIVFFQVFPIKAKKC